MTDRLQIVCDFADRVLDLGRDRFRNSPLLCDGVNVSTLEPVTWLQNGKQWVISNVACHMNLYRTLIGLTNLTGDAKYRQRAVDEVQYLFDNYVDCNGLPYWGGHWFVDLATGQTVGEARLHEFKSAYPYWEFLFEVNPTATKRLIEALWNAHVLNWSNLDMTRHGTYDAPMGKLWGNTYENGPVFFEGKGLTFIRAGSDLVYAGGMLHHFMKETGPLEWARRLAYRYVEARDPVTGLGAYQYSQPTPSAGRGQVGTNSAGGDRARNQFGPEFGERALEGKVFDYMRGEAVNALSAIAQMRLFELLGEAGREFLDWSVSGMLAYAKQAYDPSTNIITSMFTDGTKILPEDVKRPGYYGPQNFTPRPASALLLFAYSLAWRLTKDPALWQVARAMFRHRDIGEIGERPDGPIGLHMNSQCDDPVVLLALLEIADGTGRNDFISQADRIADNIVAMRRRNGLFVSSQKHRFARFSALEPLALLSVEAARRGKRNLVPSFNAGQAYIQAPYDGHGRATDSGVIWSVMESE